MKLNTITLHQICKIYTHPSGQIRVLDSVYQQFDRDSYYAITGASGSGKSTLLHILGLLDGPTSGYISFNGESLIASDETDRTRLHNQHIGFVFQNPYLIYELSVLENVMIKGLIAGLDYTIAHKQAYELLEWVGLAHCAHQYSASLSGGQQQRVALARALFGKPSFLLADEPTGNLDVATGQQIGRLLEQCHMDWGMGLIVVSHDQGIMGAAHTVFDLNNGKLENVGNVVHGVKNNAQKKSDYGQNT